MRKVYLDMKYIGAIPEAYRLSAAEVSAAAGVNLGNLVFRHALRYLLQDLDSFEPMTGPEFRAIEAKDQIDHMIISCANWLGSTQRDELFNGGRAEMVESVDCPVTAFGLGVQAASMQSDEPVKLGPNAIRLGRALSERAAQISVRDELTRRSLEAAGINNAVVTGCPSNFINCDPDLGKQLGDKADRLRSSLGSWGDVRTAISEVTGGHSASGAVLKRQLRMMDETPAFYILQTPGLLPFLMGERNNIPNEYKDNNPFMGEPGRLTRTLKSKGLHFTDVDAWMDFSRTCDISLGMRIHGTMVPLQAVVPSVLIAHDSRTVGLAEAMSVPWIAPQQFLDMVEQGPYAFIDNFIEQIAGYDAGRHQLAKRMVTYITENGLRPAPAVLGLV